MFETKKKNTAVAILITLFLAFSALTSEVSAAVSLPSLSGTGYLEVVARTNIAVYRNSSLTVRGTYSPYKTYNASISRNDVVYVYRMTGGISKACVISYPTAYGRRYGYCDVTKLLFRDCCDRQITSKGSCTVYKNNTGGVRYGSISKDDTVWVIGRADDMLFVIYTARSGNRAYKAGWVSRNTFDNTIDSSQNSGSTSGTLTSPVPAGAKFNRKTNDNGWYGYHDINRGVYIGMPVYSIADGTVTYYQSYRIYSGTKYLTSYGNQIEFVSGDNQYRAKYCHLNSFRNKKLSIPSYRTKRVSGATGRINLGSRSVKKGEIIGYIGTTGNSSGAHLHFELRKNGVRIDPTTVIGELV